jgi:3-hydroxyisobutyrate dehydrogenase-like beta-hydroxyacid dehydrogenase
MPLLTFDTTHHALWAEQLAHERGLAAEPTPAPAEAGAKCDIAIEYLPDEEAALVAVLRAAGIAFGMWPAPDGARS